MAISVDKGIPIPVSGQKSRYPWRQMEVGDSFEITAGTGKMAPLARATASVMYVNRVRKPQKFWAGMADGGKVRIWRVA
jgi:hypothetical protein